MKLNELECFLEVAKQGNMTVAAKLLRVGQATVSERVQQLEEDLGVTLFERSARERRLELTSAGKRLQAVAQQLANVAQEIQAEGRSGRARPKPVRIGVNESVAYAWLGGWLARVRVAQPDQAFDLKVGTTDELDVMMVGGSLDFAIGTRGFGYRAIERRQLVALPMVFVGTAGRYTQREYSLEELATEGLITFQAQSLQAQSLQAKLRAEGIHRYRLDTVSSIGSSSTWWRAAGESPPCPGSSSSARTILACVCSAAQPRSSHSRSGSAGDVGRTLPAWPTP